MRFGLEVIDIVRQAAGKDVAIGIRVSGHDFLEGGHTDTESALFCAEAEKTGVDCINVTGGWHETNVPQITGEVPPGAFLHLARAIKSKVKVPVFASNRLGDPVLAERALRSGAADMICWGRPLRRPCQKRFKKEDWMR
jgi:2,4-dienoyl-CoA reductase (NADPH2)